MTRDEIISTAREACDADKVDAWYGGFWTLTQEELERFAAIVAAAEREAILSKATKAQAVDGNCAIVLVADIRARSQA